MPPLPPPAATRRYGSRSAVARALSSTVRSPLFPAMLFIASLAFPDQLAQHVGGLHLPIYRIVLLFLLPLSLVKFIGDRIRFTAPDFFIVAFSLLQFLVLIIHYGPFATISVLQYSGITPTNISINAGSTLIETLGPYFLARAYIRNRADASAAVRILIVMVVIVGALALPETLTGNSMFGNDIGTTVRHGFYRAMGPFPGPIQWGLFAASVFALSLARGIIIGGTPLWRTIIALLVFGAAMTSVSSAAFAAIAIQILIVAWLILSSSMKHRGYFVLSAGVALYIFLAVFSNRPALNVIFDYAALDSWTGYYRTLIWQYGGADFLSSPLIGIGFDDWARPAWMTPSIDAFWLVILLRYGLVGGAPLILGIIIAIQRATRALPKTTMSGGLDIAYCWLVSVISLVVAGFTVHFWLQSYVDFFLLLGMWAAFIPKRTEQRLKGPARPRARDTRFGAQVAQS